MATPEMTTSPVPAPANGASANVNPSALAGIRFLLAQRVQDLEGSTDALERELLETAEDRERFRLSLEEAEARWTEALSHLQQFADEEINQRFSRLATVRANYAAADGRFSQVSTRLKDLTSEQEVLRSLHRGLDDLTAASDNNSGSDRLRRASRQVFQVVEEERMRIARDMHDGPAQAMANLVLQAEILERLIQHDPAMVLKELSDFKDGVRAVLDETRRLIFDLRPMTLDDLGLVPTLRKFVKEFGDKYNISTHLRVVGEEARLPGGLEQTLFRIIQEALNNAKKHSQAQNVDVVVSFMGGSVTAAVRDDGVGMDVAAVEAGLDRGKNLGLISMRERADLEKGALEIRSEPGKGTELRATFRL